MPALPDLLSATMPFVPPPLPCLGVNLPLVASKGLLFLFLPRGRAGSYDIVPPPSCRAAGSFFWFPLRQIAIASEVDTFQLYCYVLPCPRSTEGALFFGLLYLIFFHAASFIFANFVVDG